MARFTDNIRLIFGNSRVLSVIALANIIIFIIMFAISVAARWMHFDLEPVFTNLLLCSDHNLFIHHPWTLLTYMVVQFSFIHFLFNILWLLWFGRLIRLEISDSQLLWIYIAGGIAGGLAFLAKNMADNMPGYLAGCSASVAALMSASLILIPNLPMRFLFFGEVRFKWIAIGSILLLLAGSATPSMGTLAAHGGGIIAGLIMAVSIRYKWFAISSSPDNITTIFPDRKKRMDNEPVRTPPPGAGGKFHKAVENRLCDADRLDQLLDKIRISGYDSLSELEKNELNAISKRLS